MSTKKQDVIELTLAVEKDVELLHRLQKEAFMPLFEKYQDEETSPVKESKEVLAWKITEPNAEFYIINLNGEAVGGIRIRHYEGNEISKTINWISPIFVIPAFQNRGIAGQVIQKVFELYPQTRSWRLDTIKQEAGNCHLYEKCGFVRVGDEHIINEQMTLVGYEKNMSPANKNLIHLKDLSRDSLFEIFHLTDKLVGHGADKILQGKTIVLFFPESSIRTRVTFEKGIQELGGTTILFPPSALDKKEKLVDVMGYLANWADAVVVRHSDLSLVEALAEQSTIPVINAMTSENHPCEIIADMYALSKRYADFTAKKFLFVGAKGNIGNSWKAASELMGFELEQCCPAGYEVENKPSHRNLEEAVVGKDIICTDSIPEKAREDFKDYQITLQHMKTANTGAILNPCPPFYRGEEVAAEVIDSEYFVGYGFKRHLLEVQQAIICYLLK